MQQEVKPQLQLTNVMVHNNKWEWHMKMQKDATNVLKPEKYEKFLSIFT